MRCHRRCGRVLDRATATDPARRYADAAAFGRALTESLGVPGMPLLDDGAIENPYKGLRAFAAADAGDFFGRERLVERLVARLGAPGTRGRFVAVVGPSGSGKSSVVRAGLVPALAQRGAAESADWFRIEMAPAPHPVRAARGGPHSGRDRPAERAARRTPGARRAAPGGPSRAARTTTASCCW